MKSNIHKLSSIILASMFLHACENPSITEKTLVATGLQQATHECLKAKTDGLESIVQDLYNDYPLTLRKAVHNEPKEVLSKYFDETLANLFVENYECQVRENGICRISANVLYFSQDPVIVDLSVCAFNPEKSTVDVKFLDNSTARVVSYKLRSAPLGWRISNIRYTDGSSLVETLSSKQ